MKEEFSNRPKSDDEPFLIERTRGYFEYQLPVSAKGVLIQGDSALLVGNPRGEWELPGGKLELGETLERTVEREIEEEVGVDVVVHVPVHAWVYEITAVRHVFVIAYGVTAQSADELRLSVAVSEVGRAEFLALSDLDDLTMPEPYRVAIRRWQGILSDVKS